MKVIELKLTLTLAKEIDIETLVEMIEIGYFGEEDVILDSELEELL